MKSGIYWAKGLDGYWTLVFVEEYDDKIYEQPPNVQGGFCFVVRNLPTKKANNVYFFGNDQEDKVENYVEFIKANLTDPDGNYYDGGDNYQGN